jgi:hypothetical protein
MPYFHIGKTGGIAARPRQASDVAGANRIVGLREHDRRGAGRLEQRPHASSARRQDDVRCERNQFRRIFAKAVGIASGPTCVDPHVAPIGPAQFLQSLHESHETGPTEGIV